MTNMETNTLVFKDQAGGYFLVPRETLEHGRVPAERTAEVERLIAASAATRSSEGDDTQGYFWPLVYVIAIAVGIAGGIGSTGPEVQPVDTRTLMPVEKEWRGTKF